MHGEEPERDDMTDQPAVPDRSASTALIAAFVILVCMFFAFLLAAMLNRHAVYATPVVVQQAPVQIMMRPTTPAPESPECGCDTFVTPEPPSQTQVQSETYGLEIDRAQSQASRAEDEVRRLQAD